MAVEASLYAAVAPRLANWWRQGVIHNVESGIALRDGVALLFVRVELDRAEDAERVADAVRFAAGKLSVTDFESLGRTQLVDWLRDRLLVEAYQDLEQIYAPSVSRFVRAYGLPDYLRYWSAMVAVQLKYSVDGYADRYLSSARSVAVLVEPDHNTASVSGEGAGGPTRADNPLPVEEDLAGLTPPPPERIAGAARAPGLDRAERRTLPNGLEVVVARRGTLPVADVRLVIRTDTDGTKGSPFGLKRLALSSSGSAFSGMRQFALGAERFGTLTPDAVVMGARGSSGNLEGLLDSISKWAREQVTGHTDLVTKAMKQHLGWDARRPSRRAYHALLSSLFPDHPYGRALQARDLDEIGFMASEAWIGRQIRPERATLVIASDVAPSPELWAFIEGEFGKWKRGDAAPPEPAAEPPLPAPSRVVLVERRGASQALLWTGVRAPARSVRDEPALRGLEWLLASRLQKHLRVEQGVSYGVRVTRLERDQAAGVLVAAAVDRDAAAASLGRVLSTLRSLGESPVPAATAAWAGWQVARDYGFRFDTVAGASEALEELALDRRPPDSFEKQADSIASLDPGRMQAAARSLALGREAVVVVGDREVLEPQLRKAGYRVEVLAEPAGK
jgi:zinc protease